MYRTLSALALSLITLVVGCGGGGGHANNAVVENACLAACDHSQAMCPAADASLCASVCPSYGLLIASGSACETAYVEYQACRESATFTCVGDYAYIAGTECDVASAACDAACDSPCL